MPPEMLGSDESRSEVVYSFAIDMWCFGQTIHRALTGRSPFDSILGVAKYCDDVGFPKAILEGLDVSDESVSFISSLMAADPKKRLLTGDAMSHPWILMETLSPPSSGGVSGGQ